MHHHLHNHHQYDNEDEDEIEEDQLPELQEDDLFSTYESLKAHASIRDELSLRHNLFINIAVNFFRPYYSANPTFWNPT